MFCGQKSRFYPFRKTWNFMIFLIFFDTSFGIDCWWVLALISAPFWEPFGVIFHVFSRSILGWIFDGIFYRLGTKTAPKWTPRISTVGPATSVRMPPSPSKWALWRRRRSQDVFYSICDRFWTTFRDDFGNLFENKKTLLSVSLLTSFSQRLYHSPQPASQPPASQPASQSLSLFRFVLRRADRSKSNNAVAGPRLAAPKIKNCSRPT